MAYDNGSSCANPQSPYNLHAGDFDNDDDDIKDDLIFAAGQGWVYRTRDGWNSPMPWDANCMNSENSGSVPDKRSGSGDRFGYAPLPLGGLMGDEIIAARTRQVMWNFDFASDGQLTDWPGGAEIIGAAVGRSAGGDPGIFDLVGWEDGQPTLLHGVRLTDPQNHRVTFDTFSIDFGASRPTAGSVLSVMERQRLLLLVDSTLYLIDPTNTVSPVVNQVEFPFTPRFFVTPNWGTELQPIVLTFNSDSGEYLCHSFNKGGEFTPCGS